MATLAGSTIASTYTYLLKMDGTSGLTSSLVAVQDGDATDSALKISTTSASVAHTVTTAASTPKALFIDANTSGVAAQNATGMHIDFDRTVAGSGTAAHNDIGIDLDVNSASLGTSSLVGMDIDVVGASSGTSTATGLAVTVGSADTNYAALFSGGNVGIGVTTPSTLVEIQGGLTTTGAVLTLSTKETTVVADDVLGKINFQAPLEGSGTDAILPGASIHAIATDTFAAANNETALIFSTASSDAELGSATSGAVYERMRISSAGNVNIGSSTFYGTDGVTLEVNSVAPGTGVYGGVSIHTWEAGGASTGPQLTLARSKSDSAGNYAIVADDDRIGQIFFKGADSNSFALGATIVAFVDGSPSNGDMPTRLVFATAADGSEAPTDRMTIDSSGNVGIDVVPSNWPSNGDFRGLQIGTGGALFGRGSGDGAKVGVVANGFYDVTNDRWSYTTSSYASYHYQVDGAHAFYTAPSGSANAAITFTERLNVAQAGDVTVSTGDLVIGTSGKGISFAATSDGTTMSSEVLDDYEEGTWVMALSTSGGGSITINTSNNTGYYTKIGRIVHAIGFWNVSAISSPVGALYVSLPFTSANESEAGGDCAASVSANNLVANNLADLWAHVPTNTAAMHVYLGDGNDLVADAAEQIDTGSDMRFNVTYMVPS